MKKKTVSIFVRVISLIVGGMIVYSISLFTLINNHVIAGGVGYVKKILVHDSQGVQNYIDDVITDLKQSTLSLKDSFYNEYEQKGFEPRFVNGICHDVTRYYDADGAIIVDAAGKKVTTTSLGQGDFSKYIKRAIAGEEVSSVFYGRKTSFCSCCFSS